MLDGTSNKIAFVVVLLSAICWVAYITGFNLRYEQLKASDERVVSVVYFFHWLLAVSAGPFYCLTFFHLLCGVTATAILVLSGMPLFLVAIGGVLNSDGSYLYSFYHLGQHSEYEDYLWVEFGGAVGALFFYWISLMVWTFHSYSRHKGRTGEGYQRIN